MNSRFNITSLLYVCNLCSTTIIFSKNIVINEKLFVKLLSIDSNLKNLKIRYLSILIIPKIKI